MDQVYDCSTQDLLKKDIISDLSRILGLTPCKNDGQECLIDSIFILTDADPDGYSIRSGLITIFMRAFPKVIEEGRLFVVEPPLFGFTDNGKKLFSATNREYITYLQEKFSKSNDLYFNKIKMSKTEVKGFLLRNENYLDCLEKLANTNICTEEFIELVCANLTRLGNSKKSIESWSNLIKTKFSPQLKTVWNDGCIEISGIKDGDWNMIELTDDFVKSKKTQKLVNLMNMNLGNIYGYGIDGVDSAKNLPLSKVLRIFNKYSGKNLSRFKGLGEMDPEDLRVTCLNSEFQRLVQITTKDVNKAWEKLALWNSSKPESRQSRQDFMLKYIPDLKELST